MSSGRHEDDVPVEPFQRAFKNSDVSLSELARRLGYVRPSSGAPDTTRIKRELGLAPHHYSRGYGNRLRTSVRLETAERLAEALHLDPVDAGF